MTWPSSVHWWHLRPAIALALIAVAVPAVIGPTFATPQMSAVGVVVLGPTAIVSGIFGAFAISAALKEPVTLLPWVGPRDIRVWRAVRVIALLGATTVLVMLTSGEGVPAVLVCLLSLGGEALLTAAVLWEDIAWSIPVLHAGMVLTFGTDVFGDPHAWAWFLSPQPAAGDLAIALALFAVGLTVWAYRPPRS